MNTIEKILKPLMGLAIIYVVFKIILAILGIWNILPDFRDFIRSTPHLDTIIVMVLVIGSGYYIIKY